MECNFDILDRLPGKSEISIPRRKINSIIAESIVSTRSALLTKDPRIETHSRNHYERHDSSSPFYVQYVVARQDTHRRWDECIKR
mmetsp:Transcript_9987/g.17507  ORF Transcript_9987/g.17507 Transcript_9987/m.17507 type:complete len:85 (+) Transcript_9987:771-1025(+)